MVCLISKFSYFRLTNAYHDTLKSRGESCRGDDFEDANVEVSTMGDAT
jgi:hypothetical protein